MIMYTALAALLISMAVVVFACTSGIFSPPQGQFAVSPHYREGSFRNQGPVRPSGSRQSMFKASVDFLRGNPDRVPAAVIPAEGLTDFAADAGSEYRLAWLGHSTCLIALNGVVILTDPMFSDRASPVSFLGPKRFATRPLAAVRDLPWIDAVLISHDHYDHLDHRTILSLREKVGTFYVPLGVGAHLRRWGVSGDRIVELDWWQQQTHGQLTFVATPSQHFSGRGLRDRNGTLWCSWVILGRDRRLFFGGDSGYFAGFAEIGKTYGPFDLTMLESGAYNSAWADIHMMLEESVQAHLDLRGMTLLPIHWAGFNLALHPWKEPICRLLTDAQRRAVQVTTPRIGEVVRPDSQLPRGRWWQGV